MKKTISVFLSILMLLSAVACVDFSAFAAPSINSKDISLYFLTEKHAERISIPSNYNQSFQLRVSGASSVSYDIISGDTATVSSSGLVQPKSTTYYWYNVPGQNYSIGSNYPMPEYGDPIRIETNYEEGDTVISVTADSSRFDVTVHVNNYSTVYADQYMDDYIKKNVKSGMTDYEKVELCAKLPASFDYSDKYSGAASMIVMGGGDCWASTDLVIKLAKKMGFDTWARNGNKDWGAGSGHMNALVQVTDGTLYEVEAGYDEPAPRYYSVRERTSLFSYRYVDPIEVYQYDGKVTPEVLVVPDSIDGKKVARIGEDFLFAERDVKKIILPDGITEIKEGAFNSCTNLESINLPASLKTLGNFVFANCSNLKEITSKSLDFPVKDGVIYNKDKSVVLYAPAVTRLNLPGSVTEIGFYSLRTNHNIESFEITNPITLIGEGAFAGCDHLKSINLSNGKLKKIGNHAFAECSELTRAVVPLTVTEIGDGAFLRDTKLTQVTLLNKNCVIYDSKYVFPEDTILYGYTGSTLEAYAKKYNRKFVSIDNCKHTATTEVITKAPTCSQTGTKDIRCDICDKVIKSNVSIPTTAHTEVIDVKPVAATCTTTGRTKGSHCSMCNQALSTSKEIPALGHQYSWKDVHGLVIKNCDRCQAEVSRLQFEDLGNCVIYADYVEYTSSFNKFISGTNPPEYTLFSPATPITRAMFVAILYRMAGNPYDNSNPYANDNPFTDIQPGAYYYNAACWALDEGITNQTTFKPYDNVTREQTARFLFAYAEANDMLGDEAYKNVNIRTYPDYDSVHSWAVEPLQWANYNDMMTGTSQGYINPQGATQRIHATRILYGFGKACNIGNFE